MRDKKVWEITIAKYNFEIKKVVLREDIWIISLQKTESGLHQNSLFGFLAKLFVW